MISPIDPVSHGALAAIGVRGPAPTFGSRCRSVRRRMLPELHALGREDFELVRRKQNRSHLSAFPERSDWLSVEADVQARRIPGDESCVLHSLQGFMLACIEHARD